MWEVLNPHRGGSHVLKRDFDDWIKLMIEISNFIKTKLDQKRFEASNLMNFRTFAWIFHSQMFCQIRPCRETGPAGGNENVICAVALGGAYE